MDSTKLQNAANVVAFCKRKQKEEHLAYPNAHQKVSRFFHLMKPKDVDQNVAWDCKNITSSRALHSVTLVSPRDITFLKLWNLTCFCLECMDDNSKFCENKSHVLLWALQTFEPTNI
jgi:hypothetical protein